MADHLHWQRINGEWWLSKDAVLVEMISYNHDSGQYVDSKGKSLSKTFDGARDEVEKRLGIVVNNARVETERLKSKRVQ